LIVCQFDKDRDLNAAIKKGNGTQSDRVSLSDWISAVTTRMKQEEMLAIVSVLVSEKL
jgi:hypothetical protein